MSDWLTTEGLVESGAVDFIWGCDWRAPTRENLELAQHMNDRSPGLTLPESGVIVCFISHWRDMIATLARDNPNGRYIVVLRDGDPHFRQVAEGPLPSCIKHCFSIAVRSVEERVTAMPMGFHAFRSMASNAEEGFSYFRERRNRVLVAFSLHRWFRPGHERLTAVAHFARCSLATVADELAAGGDVLCPLKYPSYLKAVREHDYLCVPLGDGIDQGGAERIAQWEAMMLGTIPIILRKHSTMTHFSDMPIAFVDDWSEVTPEWCDANLGIINRPLDKIRLSYWVDAIRQKRCELGI